MPDSLKTAVRAGVATLALAAVAPVSASAADCPYANAEPDEVSVGQYSDGLLCAINAKRREWQRNELRLQRNLARAAGSHAADMATEGYFSHTSRDGDSLGDRLDQANFIPRSDRWRAGENLAAGEASLGTPAAIVTGWMNSRDHRINLLDPGYTMIGLGVARGWPAPGDQNDNAMTIDIDLGWRVVSRRSSR